MSSVNDLVSNVRGISGTERYGERSYLPGEAMALAAVPVLQGEVDSGVNFRPPQASAWNIYGY